MKIIIIGAGIAGLTLALGCERAKIEVKIYDKAKKLRHIGGGVLLWPNSLRYLEWLGLSKCLTPFAVPIKSCKILGTRGQTILAEDYSYLYSILGNEFLPIDRSLLQQTLLAQLSRSTLELNKECIAIQNDENEARVFFADGSQDQGDIIIGADGIYSAVRRIINSDTNLEYTNYCWWGGIIEQKYVPNLPANEVYVAMAQGKAIVVWPIYGNRFMWYLPVKMPESQYIHDDDKKILQSICVDWFPEIQQIISAPESAQGFHLAIHSLSPQLTWTNHRIALIGDAAHAIGPILGQGANQAIEDAFVLVECLKNEKRNPYQALKRYEELRRARTDRIHELEKQSAASMINDDLLALELFLQQLQGLDLATIYHDLIPLVDKNACQNLRTQLMEIEN